MRPHSQEDRRRPFVSPPRRERVISGTSLHRGGGARVLHACMDAGADAPLARLLGEADWITSLARALVHDRATADDAVQDTWLAVLRAGPRAMLDPRPWLATILRRRVQRLARGERRRQRRDAEHAADAFAGAAPSAADLTARVALHRELTDAVLALDEPYRGTIVLRFFEHLTAAQIAARTRCHEATVRSRLQRGLRLLRERLDRAPGGRARWLPAVAALAARALPHELPGAALAAAGLGANLGVGILMKKTLLGAAALAAAVLLCLPWFRADGASTPSSPQRADAPLAGASAAASAAAAEPTSAERTPVAAAHAQRIVGRQLVGSDGQPLAGVRMGSRRGAVRWQGGDRGWISGPGKSLFVPAADEERLLADPTFAATFFAQFVDPQPWRAAMLGEPMPTREAATAADGSFVLPADVAADDHDVDVVDAAFVLLEAGAHDERPWRAGPAARVTGTLRTGAGSPVAAAFVLALVAGEHGAMPLPAQLEVRSGDDGGFLVRKAATNGFLRVRCPGYATAFVPLGGAARQHVDVVLTPRAPHDAVVVGGLVVDGSGRPIAGAQVWFGRQQMRTGNDGRFELSADDADREYALTVVKDGYAPLQRDRLGADVGADTTAARDLLLVLNERPQRLRGLVLGSDGAPLAGALVGVVDPTLLDLSFTPVEARIGGWNGGVAAAGDGTFVLPGLGARRYRLRALDPATGASATSAPLRPGLDEVVLRLPTDLRRGVRGRVRSARSLVQATVEVGYCTHVTKGGGTQFDAAPAIAVAADGTFVLPALPPRDAWLCVREGGGLFDLWPVEAFADASELDLTCGDHRWLQLVGSAHARARPLAFATADGNRLVAVDLRGAAALLAADGSAPVLALPAAATAVVVDPFGPAARHLTLTDDRAVHLRVR
jgi:RNA polymerase sigma factor (sigma-70 family)